MKILPSFVVACPRKLQRHWLMMGALEAADGVLLFGISTAYMFTVMQAYWPLLFARSQTHSR